MMKYFSYLGDWNSPKNNYQKAILEHLKQRSNVLTANVGAFKNDLMKTIKGLREQFPRCKEVAVSFYSMYNEGWGLSTDGTDWSVQYFLYPVKEEEG